jgi:hypothetical protein
LRTQFEEKEKNLNKKTGFSILRPYSLVEEGKSRSHMGPLRHSERLTFALLFASQGMCCYFAPGEYTGIQVDFQKQVGIKTMSMLKCPVSLAEVFRVSLRSKESQLQNS